MGNWFEGLFTRLQIDRLGAIVVTPKQNKNPTGSHGDRSKNSYGTQSLNVSQYEVIFRLTIQFVVRQPFLRS